MRDCACASIPSIILSARICDQLCNYSSRFISSLLAYSLLLIQLFLLLPFFNSSVIIVCVISVSVLCSLRRSGVSCVVVARPTHVIMAAIAESGRFSKVQLRTCLKFTNRLSDLCYDKHTLCEKCCNQVCGYNSFCDECRSWSTDFRKMYVKHQRTLHQKRVSKQNAKAKAKSAPVVDDSASNVSIESHASIPVVILALDSVSVDIADNISNIQDIDNVVEIQLPQPEVPPPPPPGGI